MTSPKPWMRLVISAFLLFHLLGVLVAPNPNSYLYQSIAPVYRPYMNALGIGHTWGFFAPEPVSPPMYIDYIVDHVDGTQESGRFPDENNPYFFRDRYNRRLTLSRFILANDENIRNMFIRRFCLPDASAIRQVRLWRTVGSQPSLDEVRRGERKVTESPQFKIEVLGTYYCPEIVQ